jgi:hypothetical protein
MNKKGKENKNDKYDVAFSFLEQDEALADEINQMLKSRISTFIYSEHQEQLVGKDGEKLLNEIFHDRSRVVCVLYRKGWGESPWTRIEETAIKNRAFNSGYDFTIFVPLDKNPLPKWIPKTYIYYGLERYGIEGLAPVIEAKVQEHEGVICRETPSDKILSYLAEKGDSDRRQSIIDSTEGVRLANQEIQQLFDDIEKMSKNSDHKIRVLKERSRMVMLLNNYSCDFIWRQQFSNTLKYATLYLFFFEGIPQIGRIILFEEPKKIRTWKFKFAINLSDKPCWVNEGDQKTYLTKDLLDFSVNELLSQLKKHKGD